VWDLAAVVDSIVSSSTILPDHVVCELDCQVAFHGQGPPLTLPQPEMLYLLSPVEPLAVVAEWNVPEA
jgi:hypothetical protein